MPYDNLVAEIPARIVGATLKPGTTFGAVKLDSSVRIPDLPSIPFGFGTTAGLLNLISIVSGSLNPTTPGTTDILLVDLQALKDPINQDIALTKAVVVLVLNDSIADANVLKVGGAGAVGNAWGAPFDGDQDAKLTVLPGFVAADGSSKPGLALLSGGNTTSYAVAVDSKVLKLDGGANTVPFRLVLLGRG